MRAFAAFLLLSVTCLAEVPILWEPPAGFPPTLRDIAARLPANTPAKEPDLITYGHEGSHFLSRFRPGEHGLYDMGGRHQWVPIPPVKTAALFLAIPHEHRGTIYETYRRQGEAEGWRDRPTMVLDEWLAYLRGSQIRRELGIKSRSETDRHGMTMARYAQVLYKMSRNCEGYDPVPLRDWCRWTLNASRTLIPEWDPSIRFD